jgi:hypothetical protein
MKFSITEQDKGDLLIQVAEILFFIYKMYNKSGQQIDCFYN